MPYWRMFYHVVWATKHRAPAITPEIEALIFPTIAEKARELGAVVYALNGMADHVHLAVAIPPRIAVGRFVGDVKGRSSYAVRRSFDPEFSWQEGYGAHTFGEKQLPWVMRYIEMQKQHHAEDGAILRLEVVQDDENGPPGILLDR